MHVEVFINLTHGGTVEKKIFLYLFWSQISIILLIFFSDSYFEVVPRQVS